MGIRNGSLLLAVLLLLIGLTACSGSNDSNSGSVENEAAAPAAQDAKGKADSTSFSVNDQFGSTEVQVTSAQSEAAAVAPKASAASDTNVGGGGIGPIADANAGFDRKVIYRANLVMKVKEFAPAEEELVNLIHLSGAYVLQFSDSRNTDEVGATYVIKVPSNGFSPFLEKLQKIKNLKLDREVEGSDVTEEFVDLEARLKAKQTVEERLLAFMDKATKSDDLVRFSNELGNVQQEIEQIKGRMRYLDQNVAFSTINLRLYQASGIEPLSMEEDEGKAFAERISDAISGSTKVLRQFGEGLLVVVAAMLPVLIVLSVIGIPVYFLVRRRQNTRRKNAEETRKSWNNQQSGSQGVSTEIPEADSNADPEPLSDVKEQQTKDEDR
ncbi:DUF4349 domain-containing protein [Cohnella sp.]|uniref:DUF4349 domain-containing protein n=1 Tax=Cohnella sp. TaxID=1883426 RepID=UPI0035645EBC